MSHPQRTQCLIFIIHRESNQEPDYTLERSNIDALSLLPNRVKSSHPDVVALLFSNGIEVIDGTKAYPSLFSAVSEKRVEICEILLDETGAVHGSEFRPPEPLHIAAGAGTRKIVKLLLPKNIVIHPMKNVDSTCIHTAIDDINLKFMDVILSHGADIRYRHLSGGTLLHFAVENGYRPLLMSLLNHGASVNAVRKDGTTPLHSAAFKGHIQITKDLLEHGANANATMTVNSMSGNFTPLHAAIARKNLKVASCLLENGSNVDAECSNGFTCLHRALWNECSEYIKLLLKYHPDVNNANNKKAFALALIESDVHSNYKRIAEELYCYGFSVDSEHRRDIRVLQGAVRANLLELVKELISDGADFHAQDPVGKSLLHIAAKHAKPEMISWLLDKGAYVDSKDELQRSPVFDAIEAISLKNLKALKESDANFSCADISGLTPLHVAAGNSLPGKGRSSIVEFLLQLGANLNGKCSEGNSPLFYAVQRGSLSVVLVLLKFGAHFDFMDRILPEVYEAFSRRPNVFFVILDNYFFDAELFADLWNRFTLAPSNEHSIHPFMRCKTMLQHYGFKMTVATLTSCTGNKLDSFKDPVCEKFIDFKLQCETEFNALKNAKVGNTIVTYYDILMKSPDQIARYLNNPLIAAEVESEYYKLKFPKYYGILRAKFLQGNLRKALLLQGIKAYKSLFHNFTELPLELQEKILLYLKNEEIRNLLIVCNLTHIRFEPVMRMNIFQWT